MYSHVAKVNRGTMVYISGQVPSDAYGKIIGEGDFEAQVEQVFANLKIAVEAAGGVMADIVKLNYFLAAVVDQAENAPDTRPLSQCCQAAGQYICCREPPDAAGVADRDRGGCGHRRLSRLAGRRRNLGGFALALQDPIFARKADIAWRQAACGPSAPFKSAAGRSLSRMRLAGSVHRLICRRWRNVRTRFGSSLEWSHLDA